MIVVADTSPLNYLIRAGYVRILHDLFGRVLVPQAVLVELLHANAPPDVRSFAESPPAWLECVSLKAQLEGFSVTLGAGEREAISLALQVHAEVILIDDLEGRIEAKARQIPARGTLAILLQAALRGYLDFPEAFEQLTRLGFRTSPSIKKAVFDEYDRSKNV
jgi:predicted nucleic acid-binding protein